jgi:hypothetical protein
VSAGSDQSITLPANAVSLTGSGADTDGSIASYAWTKVSGPASGVIGSPSQASTQVTGLVQGTYIFQLTVTDNAGATASDDVMITVNPSGTLRKLLPGIHSYYNDRCTKLRWRIGYGVPGKQR